MTNCKCKLKKGDEVIVIAGKDKGRKGTVRKVSRSITGTSKVLVDGINMVKKHVKPNPQANKPGGIIEQEAYLNSSNVMLLNPVTNKGERVGFRLLEDGRKVRCFKSSGDVVDIDKA